MAASESFAEFLREQLAPLGRVTMRRMFGKTGVFCDGVMLGMVTDNTLYFRVDDDNRAIFQEAASFPPLNYAKAGRHHRPFVLARAGAPVRRARRARRLGAGSARRGAAGRGKAEGRGARTKTKASTMKPHPPSEQDAAQRTACRNPNVACTCQRPDLFRISVTSAAVAAIGNFPRAARVKSSAILSHRCSSSTHATDR